MIIITYFFIYIIYIYLYSKRFLKNIHVFNPLCTQCYMYVTQTFKGYFKSTYNIRIKLIGCYYYEIKKSKILHQQKVRIE